MDEEFVSREYSISDFMKPDCPVKIGDKFYKNYHVPNPNNYGVVTEIEEKQDDNGTYYIITAKYPNIAVGINIKKLSSRMFTPGAYTIVKKGEAI
jgi:hypothetical protein